MGFRSVLLALCNPLLLALCNPLLLALCTPLCYWPSVPLRVIGPLYPSVTLSLCYWPSVPLCPFPAIRCIDKPRRLFKMACFPSHI